MSKSRPSAPAAINLTLLIVSTLILVSFGVVDSINRRDRYYSDLHQELGALTDQLGSSLALPLWNFQDDQATKIIENALSNKSVVAVQARDTITQRVVASRVRLADGSIVQHQGPPEGKDLIYKDAKIVFNAREIGKVRVWGTPEYVREAMRQALYRMAVGITLLNAALIAMLSLMLNRSVVKPLKAVESYALAVSAREDADAQVPKGFYLRELENLRDSIVIMVRRLNERMRELRESQSGLAEAEARYRDLYENAQAGIYRSTPQGRFVSANSAMAQILGYPSPSELIAAVEDLDSQVFVADPALADFRLNLTVRGKASKVNVRFRRADGDIRIGTIHAKATLGQDGIPLYYDGMLEDITDRTRAEERLREAHGFIQNILDSMPSMMIGIDGDLNITHVNVPAETAMGLSHGDIIGRPLTQALPRMASNMDAVRQALGDVRPATLGNRPYLRDGQLRQENILVFPVVQNGIPGAVIRIDDVTDQARMEELILQTEKMMSLGGLAAGMAHEINNPLAGILQGVQNIVRRFSPELPANEEAARQAGCSVESLRDYLERRDILEFLSGIQESGQRAAKIVSNMLSFTRRSSASSVSVKLDELLNRSVELASTDYDLKKKYDFKLIEIRREYAPDMPQVRCYPMEIEQVVINLLRNAAQAMYSRPKEGVAPVITIRLHLHDGNAVIEVEDNGPGIEDKDRTRVFDPFFTTKKPGEGTGLGLSVSYFIITRNHGGAIQVESEPGHGAKFVVTLPIRDDGLAGEQS